MVLTVLDFYYKKNVMNYILIYINNLKIIYVINLNNLHNV